MKATPVTRQRIVHGAAAVAVVALLASATWMGYDAICSQPIRQVAFVGSTGRIPAPELDALVARLQGAPVACSLGEVRESAGRLAWVRNAAVRRRSPDTLEIRFETHEPLARWNDEALVSDRGEVFRAKFDEPLPRFRAGDAAAPLVARQYPALAKAVEPLESAIAEVRLSPRGAWQLTLQSGLVLDLGRGDLEARIARFASAWPELQRRGVQTVHADLRYANGFALRTRAGKT